MAPTGFSVSLETSQARSENSPHLTASNESDCPTLSDPPTTPGFDTGAVLRLGGDVTGLLRTADSMKIVTAFAAALLFGQLLAADPDPAPRKTILFLGDSLAAGYGVQTEEAFPALVQEKITAAGLPYKVVNGGVSGDTSAGGLRRINWMLRQPVDVLVLELGGNDGLRGINPKETRSNLQQIIDRVTAKNADVKVVIAGMQMPANMGEEYTAEFKALFPSLAEKNGATLIPFLLEGIAADPQFNQPDLIHPNPEGHKIVAETVWTVLEPLLRGHAPKRNE